MRFKNLSEAQIGPQSVSRVHFPEIAGPLDPEGRQVVPWLEVRPAAEANRAFFNALMRSQAKNPQEVLRNGLMVEDLEKDRAESYPLYAQHVLTGNGGGWLDDETGQDVPMPLSQDDRLVLVRQLPTDLYDRIRRHAQNLGNFRV
jgi:hypothetical protein